MKLGFAEKQFFKLRFFFSHMLGLLPIHEAGPCNNSDKLRARCDCEKADCRKPRKWYSDGPLDAERAHCRDSSLQPSSLQSDTLTIMLQEPCLQGILPSDSLFALAAKGWVYGCEKSIFHALKNCFFCAAQTSLALQKHNFSGSSFLFRMPLVKFKLAPNCADACNT